MEYMFLDILTDETQDIGRIAGPCENIIASLALALKWNDGRVEGNASARRYAKRHPILELWPWQRNSP
jgi:hypothetical protein